MTPLKKVEKAGRQAWLASLGAYSLGLGFAARKLDDVFVEGNALFHELVTRGSSLHNELQQQFKTDAAFSEKVEQLRAKLPSNPVKTEDKGDELEHLNVKVEALAAVVAKLTEQKAEAEAAAKTAPAAEAKTEEAPKAAATPAPAAAAPSVEKAAETKAPARRTRKPAASTAEKPATTRARKPAAKNTTGDNSQS